MSDLKIKSHTFKMVEKYAPTTQICRKCLKLNKHSLSVRTYTCECGYKMDRDTHSALNIEDIGMGRMSYNNNHIFLVEPKELNTRMEELTSGGNAKSISMNSEAHPRLAGACDFSRG